MTTSLLLIGLLCHLAVLAHSAPRPAPHGLVGTRLVGFAGLQRLDSARQEHCARRMDELARTWA
jgi:hypothetical protein